MYMDQIAAAAEAAPVVIAPATRVPGLVLHVDGDYLAYYASGNDDTDAGWAKTNALSMIEAYRAVSGADKIVVHNTAKGCHKGERYLAASVKPYQGQRDSGRRPKNHGYLQDFLMDYKGDVFTTKTWATREADDGIGACALYAVGRNPNYIAIATADKDLRMLPGLHIDWRSRAVTKVEPGCYITVGTNQKLYGLKWFWLQMLQGDTADHIPGLERYKVTNDDGSFRRFAPCGEKTAEKMLEGTTSSEEASRIVLNEYIKGYPTKLTDALDRFVEQACLLWMRTDANATLTDFATHMGPSRINHHFCKDVMAAVTRLEERVASARKQINSFGG